MCLQIKFASRASTESLHTLVHVPSRQISSIPVLLEEPPTSRVSPFLQTDPTAKIENQVVTDKSVTMLTITWCLPAALQRSKQKASDSKL